MNNFSNFFSPYLSAQVNRIEKSVAIKRWKRSNLFELPDGFPMKTVEEFQAFEAAAAAKHDELVCGLILLYNYLSLILMNDFQAIL